MADLAFRQSQMSAGTIDDLMDVFAAWAEKAPPFANSEDLYQTIDAIKAGDAPWTSFTVQHTDAQLEDPNGQDIPSWKQASYEVIFRDPKTILQNQLSNPAFNGSCDYSPRLVFGDKHERVWSDFMTGNWAWRQCVGVFILQLSIII